MKLVANNARRVRSHFERICPVDETGQSNDALAADFMSDFPALMSASQLTRAQKISQKNQSMQPVSATVADLVQSMLASPSDSDTKTPLLFSVKTAFETGVHQKTHDMCTVAVSYTHLTLPTKRIV